MMEFEPLLLLAEANALAECRDFAEAERLYREALLALQNGQACERLVKLRMQAGDYPGARRELLQHASLIEAGRAELFGAALSALEGATGEEALPWAPDTLPDMWLCGLAAFASAQWDKAQSCLEFFLQRGVHPKWECEEAQHFLLKLASRDGPSPLCGWCEKNAATHFSGAPFCEACRVEIEDPKQIAAWIGGEIPETSRLLRFYGPSPCYQNPHGAPVDDLAINPVGDELLRRFLLKESELTLDDLTERDVVSLSGLGKVLPDAEGWLEKGRWALQIAYWLQAFSSSASDSPPARIMCLNRALRLLHPRCEGSDTTLVDLCGKRLTYGQAELFKQLLASKPNDLFLRRLRIGYLDGAELATQTAHAERLEHALWCITSFPELNWSSDIMPQHPTSRLRLLQTWFSQFRSQPDRPAILSNVSHFLTLQEPELAELLMARCCALAPENRLWSDWLGHLRQMASMLRRPDAEDETQRLAALEEELAIPSGDVDTTRVSHAMGLALSLGMLDKATVWAHQLLEVGERTHDWNCGNLLHQGHQALGLVALARDDLPAAVRELEASVGGPTSPQLSSFGPSFRLAAGLCERGEIAGVLRYLELCLASWPMGEVKLTQWAVELREGRTPDFEL